MLNSSGEHAGIRDVASVDSFRASARILKSPSVFTGTLMSIPRCRAKQPDTVQFWRSWIEGEYQAEQVKAGCGAGCLHE